MTSETDEAAYFSQLDYDLVDYVSQLREGILEAYTGIVTGFKKTDKTPLLFNHVVSILDLIQRCLKDEDRTDATMRLSYGLLGDLADTFPQGQIKQYLLSPWIANELRAKFKMPGETKKTMRWAREVRLVLESFDDMKLTCPGV
ncbi:Importin subunit beta-1 [Leucoagaricus sp. SymC.cos]|nr:Importin subunit beta-1 [Leucoagaricus sp. SymC.cos]